LAAAKHNDLRIEEEAYREDRVRDPDKYAVRVQRGTSGRKLAAMLGVLAVTPYTMRGGVE